MSLMQPVLYRRFYLIYCIYYYLTGLLVHVTVLIGISVAGKAVGGVIHQPYTHLEDTVGRTVWGLLGLGVRGINVGAGPRKKGQGLHVRCFEATIQQALGAHN